MQRNLLPQSLAKILKALNDKQLNIQNEKTVEINKHKKSIFEFWKYSNKDTVATLDEGEEEEFNVKKIEKVYFVS